MILIILNNNNKSNNNNNNDNNTKLLSTHHGNQNELSLEHYKNNDKLLVQYPIIGSMNMAVLLKLE